jgi:hypothetical protein
MTLPYHQALKYRSVTDIVRPICEIVYHREKTTGHSARPDSGVTAMGSDRENPGAANLNGPNGGSQV